MCLRLSQSPSKSNTKLTVIAGGSENGKQTQSVQDKTNGSGHSNSSCCAPLAIFRHQDGSSDYYKGEKRPDLKKLSTVE